MAKLSPAALGISVFSLVLSLGFWFLVIPQLEELHKNLQSSDKQSINVSPKAQQAVKAVTSYSQAQLVQALLPTEEKSLDITIQIEALAKSRSISLSDVKVGEAAAGVASAPKTVQAQQMQKSQPVNASAGLKKVSISITASGSWDNIQRFVADLTQIDRYIQIDQTSVSVAAGGETSVQIVASAFYLP